MYKNNLDICVAKTYYLKASLMLYIWLLTVTDYTNVII